jgi:hypothetical protein
LPHLPGWEGETLKLILPNLIQPSIHISTSLPQPSQGSARSFIDGLLAQIGTSALGLIGKADPLLSMFRLEIITRCSMRSGWEKRVQNLGSLEIKADDDKEAFFHFT